MLTYGFPASPRLIYVVLWESMVYTWCRVPVNLEINVGSIQYLGRVVTDLGAH